MVAKSERLLQKTNLPSGLVLESQKTTIYYFTKRVIDIIVSLVALIILFPFMLLVALLIRLDSPGPVIFTQKRITTMRKKVNDAYQWERAEFSFYKFRTMKHNADSSLHKAYVKALIEHDDQTLIDINKMDTKIKKLTHDPRVTRLGHILRRSSIDELPQFWNVLKGDMSLVGPRPAIPYEMDFYKPWYFRRFETKPGLTGLWQVVARCSIDFDGMVNLDIEYIEKQCLFEDLKIVFMTPVAIFLHRGAA